jgi:hypothetical protein
MEPYHIVSVLNSGWKSKTANSQRQGLSPEREPDKSSVLSPVRAGVYEIRSHPLADFVADRCVMLMAGEYLLFVCELNNAAEALPQTKLPGSRNDDAI